MVSDQRPEVRDQRWPGDSFLFKPVLEKESMYFDCALSQVNYLQKGGLCGPWRLDGVPQHCMLGLLAAEEGNNQEGEA